LFKEYPWNSTYAFAENKVIQCVDLEGLEAWPANFSANDVMSLTDFQRFATTEIQKLTASDNTMKFDCNDFAVYILLRYFQERQVEIEFTVMANENTSVTYNSSDTKYAEGDFTSFFNNVKGGLNQDIVKNSKYGIKYAENININEAGAGDMLNTNRHTEVFFKPVEGSLDLIWIAYGSGRDFGDDNPNTVTNFPVTAQKSILNLTGTSVQRWSVINSLPSKSTMEKMTPRTVDFIPTAESYIDKIELR
jgi:hypothetical protein